MNAYISDVYFGIEDHGILCFFITFTDANGVIQGIGARPFTDLNIQVIKKILDVIETDDFYKLKGTPCRIERENGYDISSIKHFVKDKEVKL